MMLRDQLYSGMVDSVQRFKFLDKSFFKKSTSLTSKAVYLKFREKYEKHPKVENLGLSIDWKKVYLSLNNKSLESRLRVINYKVLFDALSLNIKYSDRLKKKCYLCGSCNEDLEHLFVGCRVTTFLFEKIKYLLSESQVFLTKKVIFYGMGLNFEDNRLISIFKYSIWMIRCIRRKEVIDFEKTFNRIFHSRLAFN